MRPRQFTITQVEPTPSAGLVLTYADGARLEVDLVALITRHRALDRLKDRALFETVTVGEHGASVVWAGDDNLELAADNLRAWAVEQAGGVSHEFIWQWMTRNGLTLDSAARAIGVSRRMMAYYRSGEKDVPKTVGLACLGWENLCRRDRAARHSRDDKNGDLPFALAC